MSQAPQQPNFRTNVNRAKTKRWVEAKSYSYDGDDWGDADEYDEYGDYGEPTPPPPKPTGLRQRGQSATQSSQLPTQQQPPSHVDGRHGYNDIGGQPTALLPQGMHSALNPQPRVNTDPARSNSFERGDETRAFSAGGYQQGLPQRGIDVRDAAIASQEPEQESFAPYNKTSVSVQSPEQIYTDRTQPSQPTFAPQQPPLMPARADTRQNQDSARTYSLGSTSQASPPTQHPSPLGGNRAQSMTAENSLQSFSNQRKPAPIPNTPGPRAQGPPIQPAPPPSGASQPYRPPRKSSLSQQIGPQPPYDASDSISSPIEQPTEELSQRERSGSNAGKPLPFVRPADIYRRMQEEKERQSQESSRPSTDAINREHSSDESSPMLTRRETSSPQLLPVTERGLEIESRSNTAETVPSDVPSVALQKAGSEQAGARWDGLLPQIPNTSQPMLPDLTRMSRFDSSFLDFGDEGTKPKEVKSVEAPSHTAKPSPTTPIPKEAIDPSTQDIGLKHQPSAGVRSVVQQAFDQAPATPSSGTGSSVDRSLSGSTSTRSPPVSRGPSSATDNIASRMNNQRTLTPPPKIMDTVPEERRMSSSSGGTTKAERPPSGGPSKGSPKKIIPGYRRDMSTPSPDNSPARTPAIENVTHLQSPQEAEMAVATPISPGIPTGVNLPPTQAFRQDDGAQAPSTQPSTTSTWREPLPSSTKNTIPSTSRSSSPPKSLVNSVHEREGSPGTNRVKDIAGRFESASKQGSDQSLSEKTKLPSTGAPEHQPENFVVHPLTDRAESFRPQLPGGWESYGPSSGPTKRNSAIRDGPHPLAIVADQQDSSRILDQEQANQSQGQQKEVSKEKAIVSPIEHPFAALSAAGSALVGVFPAATGMAQQATDASTKQDPDKNPGIALQKRASLDSSPIAAGSAKSASTETTPRQAPPQLPSLDTERKPQYESDRLRREIVKSLSPNKTSEPTTADTESSWQASPSFTSTPNVQRSGTGLESPTLPSEYDSYWNDDTSVGSSRSNSRRRRTRSLKNAPEQLTSHAVEPPTPLHVKNNLTERERSLDQSASGEERPKLTSERYSWERPDSYQTSAVPTSTNGDRTSDPHESTVGAAFTSDAKQSGFSNEPTIGVREDSVRPMNMVDGASHPKLSEPTASREAQGINSLLLPTTLDATASEQDYSTKPYLFDTESGARGETMLSPQASTVREPQSTEDPSSLPGGTMAQPRIPGFREILALKTPRERIDAFDDARKQYANTDTGLQHWLRAKANEIEHVHSMQSSAQGPVINMQQSSSSSGSNAHLQRANAPYPGGWSQGSSPTSTAGAKLNRQQLQSKGKDLLKDANVLSGKANVAAKGLFMKGRNKLRGGDKAFSLTPSPDPPRATQPPFATRSNAPSSPFPQTPEPFPSQHPSQSLSTFQDDALTPSRSPPTKSQSDVLTPNERSQKLNSTVVLGKPQDYSRNVYDDVATPVKPQSTTREAISPSRLHTASHGDRGQLSLETGTSTKQILPGQEHPQQMSHEDNVGPLSAVSEKAPSFHLPKITPSRFSTWDINTPQTPRPGTKDGSFGENLHTPTDIKYGKNRELEAGHPTESPEIPRVREDLLDPAELNPIQEQESSIQPRIADGGLAPPSPIPLATGESSTPRSWANVEDAQPSPMSPAFQVREPSEHSLVSEDQSEQPPSPVSSQRSIIREAPAQHRPPGPIYFGPSHDFDVVHDTQHSNPIRHSRSISRLSEDLDVRNHPAFRRERSPSTGNVYQRRSGEVERATLSVPHETSPVINADEQLRIRKSLEAQAASKRSSRGSGFFRGLAPPSNQATPSPNHSEGLEEFPLRQNDGKEKRGKRGSLFRSLTGQNSSQSSRASNTNLIGNVPQEQSGPSNPPNALLDRQASDLSNKFTNTLQRSVTSGIAEPEKGKKKRFSKLGSIFGGRPSLQKSGSSQSQNLRSLQDKQQLNLGPASVNVVHGPEIQHDPMSHVNWPQGQGQAPIQHLPSDTPPMTQQARGSHRAPGPNSSNPPLSQEQRQQQYGSSMQTYLDPQPHQIPKPSSRQQQMSNSSQTLGNVDQQHQAYQGPLMPPTVQNTQPPPQPAPSEQRPSNQSRQPSHASHSSWIRRSTASQQVSNQYQAEDRGALKPVSYHDPKIREASGQLVEASIGPSSYPGSTQGPTTAQQEQQSPVSSPAQHSRSRDVPAYMEDATLRQNPVMFPLRNDSELKKSKDRSSKSKSSLFSRTKSTDAAKTLSPSSKHQKSSSWLPSRDSIKANQVQSGPLNVKEIRRLSQPLQSTSQQRQVAQPPPTTMQQQALLKGQVRGDGQQRDPQRYLQQGQMRQQPQGMPQNQPTPSSPEGAPPPPPPKDYWHVNQPRGSSFRAGHQQTQAQQSETSQRDFSHPMSEAGQFQPATYSLPSVEEQRRSPSPPPMISPIQQQQPLNFNPGHMSPVTVTQQPRTTPLPQYHDHFTPQPQPQPQQFPPSSHQYQHHRPPALPPIQTSIPTSLASPPLKSSSVLPSHPNPILGPRLPDQAPPVAEEGATAASSPVRTPKSPQEREARAREIERNSLVLSATSHKSRSNRGSRALNSSTGTNNNNRDSNVSNSRRSMDAAMSGKEVVPPGEGLEHDTRGEEVIQDEMSPERTGKDGEEEAEDDEPIVMSPVAYPGQMWSPGGIGGWEHF